MSKKTPDPEIPEKPDSPPAEPKFVPPDNYGIDIRAGSISNGLFCNYNYIHTVAAETSFKHKVTGGSAIHPDLWEAMRALDRHLPAICEELEFPEFPEFIKYIPDIHGEDSQEYKISRFRVTGFQIDGEGEKLGYILIGDKTLKSGDRLKLETPKIKEGYGYRFFTDLFLAIEVLQQEVFNYMHGKQAPKAVQTEMEFDETFSEPDL